MIIKTISTTPVVVWPYLLMLFVGLTMPSDGNHGLMSPKSLAFLASMMLFAVHFLCRQRYEGGILRLWTLFCCGVTFLLLWLFFGVMDRDILAGSATDQFKVFFITWAVVVVSVYLVKRDVLKAQTIIKVVVYSNNLYSSMKVLGATLHMAKIMDIFSFMRKTGMRFMTMDIHAGIMRLQTSVDIITPFLILFVLLGDRLGIPFSKKFKVYFCFVSILSTLLSFSRFLIAVAVLSFVLYSMTLSLPRLIRNAFIGLAVIAASVVVIGPEHVYSVVERRLYSSDNYHSDRVRLDQINALSSIYYQHPILGKGMGGFAPDCLRDAALKHSYEVQWMAFLMQFGIVGIAVLLTALAMIGWRYLVPPWKRVHWAFFALFVVWVLSGFTNPFLISLTSGIVYTLFYLVPEGTKGT